jgi:hypothetical protein
MMSHTCLIPPTGVPVDVITHWAWDVGAPLWTCRLLPTGQLLAAAVAYEDVELTRATETLAPETAMSKALIMVTTRRRFLTRDKSFIRRMVTMESYAKPLTSTRKRKS